MSLLDVMNLKINISTDRGELQAVRNVSFSVEKGEVLAIVGESGCGKTVLCRSLISLLPPQAKVVSGEINLDGRNIVNLKERQLNKIRGKELAMVFQDPMAALNPCFSVGEQISEGIRLHNKNVSKKMAKEEAIKLMTSLGIEMAEERYNQNPQQFSGGMRQRICIAIALSSNPKLLIADEATTSLDVSTQAKILELLLKIKKEREMGIIVVTHDFGVVARVADRVAVMYAGKIIEIGRAEEIFYNPQHPYTKALLASLPSRNQGETLSTIAGTPPDLVNPPKGDAFSLRNPNSMEIDFLEEPPMFQVSQSHFAATWLLDERAKEVRRQIDNGT